MSCQSNANRSSLAAVRCGVSSAAGKAAYTAGVLVGAASFGVLGGAVGSEFGALGTVAGASLGAVGGAKYVMVADRRAFGPTQSPEEPPAERYGGGLKYKAAVLGAGALGSALGAYSGASIGSTVGGAAGALVGAPLVALMSGRYWGKWTGQQIRVKRWLNSEAGQKATTEREAQLSAARAQYNKAPGIRSRLQLLRQQVGIQRAFEARAIREVSGG